MKLVTDNKQITRVDMMFAELGQSRYISKLDFTKGDWQAPVPEGLKALSTYQFSSGLY